MKNVLLSADGDIGVYSVPDEVADDLEGYCNDFCGKWLKESPDAEKYRFCVNGTVCLQYNESDFISYLNDNVCDERSALVETLDGVCEPENVPEKYRGLPYFGF